ncbi:hypothetical protein [Olleya namhaensis]|uniref:Uncharacterized protein n=1 Tax=Olleya namhaensis TaxID=1144750 RepID=A0A1I3IU54_9FLAO|nr:hypothetical protein [Olleya namhaensis]SFI51403.1 hypothetical protein SAMN05443431_101111 [Olleya namhaensis]
MNKFLQYINETLISLDIPALINLDDKSNHKVFKKTSRKSKATQQK